MRDVLWTRRSGRGFPSLESTGARGAILALGVLACLLALPAAAPAKEGPGLDAIAAPDTLLYLRCSGMDRFLEGAGGLDLVRLWMDPEVQSFTAEFRKSILEELGGEGQSSSPLAAARDLLKGDLALAVSPRLAIFAEGGATPTPALAIRMAAGKDAFLGLLNSLLEGVASKMHLERGSLEHRGVSIDFVGKPEERLTVCYAVLDDLFVATLNRYYLEALIDRRLDGKPSLAELPAYSRSMEQVRAGQGPGFSLFLNFKPLVDIVRSFVPYEFSEAVRLLGLDEMQGLCLDSHVEGGVSRDSLFLYSPGDMRGFLKALFPHPVDPESARRTPPDALLFTSMVFDPERVVAELHQFVRTMIPEAYAEFCEGFNEMNEETGFDVQEDILKPLGNELSFFVSMPEAGGMAVVPDFIVTLALQDGKKFGAFLDRLLGMLPSDLEIVETDFDGCKMRYLALPERVPFSPTLVLQPGRLLVAGSPLSMKRYLNWLKKGEPGLDQSPSFRTAVAGFPDHPFFLSFANLKKAVEMGYGTAAPFLPTILAESSIPLDAGLLPMADTVAGYISDAADFAAYVEDGILVSSRSPVGLSALAAISARLGDFAVSHGLQADKLEGMFGFLESKNAGSQVQKGYSLMSAGMYDEAEKVFSQCMDQPLRKDEWVNALLSRGYCRLKLQKYQEGIEDYKKAAQIDEGTRSLSYYNIACGYALLNNKEEAIGYLQKSIEAGYRDFAHMREDSDLDSLRGDPRFEKLMEETL